VRGRVASAAAFVLLAGAAGAGAVAGCCLWLGLFCNFGCEFRRCRLGAFEEGFKVVEAVELALGELVAGVEGAGFGEVVVADEAGDGAEVGVEVALGLEAAEFEGGAAEGVVGMGSGAVDGVVSGVGSQGRLRECAAAEAPEGVEGFGGVGLFEDGFGQEVGEEGVAEVVEFGGFIGVDEGSGGEEAEAGGVVGAGGFSGCGAGAG
jgi:hypothetical protein